MSTSNRILFLCTENSCRSQMAESMLREMSGDRFEVLSAGMKPTDAVHPLAIKAMEEIGIDISAQKPKSVKTYLGVEWIKWLIVVCNKAKQTCPRVWPLLADENRLYWPFDNPAEAEGTEEEKMQVFRRVRDELQARLREWVASLEA